MFWVKVTDSSGRTWPALPLGCPSDNLALGSELGPITSRRCDLRGRLPAFGWEMWKLPSERQRHECQKSCGE